MNFQFYMEKLSSSEEFQKFIKENPEAFLCSGFFSIDKQGKDNQQHLDFFVPKEKRIFSFSLEENFNKIPFDNIGGKIPNKLNENLDFDFGKIENIISEKFKKENINNKIQKIIFSLQKIEKKNYLIGTIFISGMGIIKININLESKEITDFEKKSFFDMLNILRKK